jgi:glycosyltransferase involved in cell wall biosynthesis
MISIYIVTKNEERNIERALKSVKGLGEIIVVDSGSTDRTVELAKQYTDSVSFNAWQGMAQQKEHAKNLCANEWVLNLDADEELSPELGIELEDLSQRADINGVEIPIIEYFLEEPINKLTKRNTHIRFFRKSAGKYGNERFHETPSIHGKIVRANHGIRHYGEISIEVKVDKNNKYSSGKAADKYEKGKKSSIFKLVTIMQLAFIKSYFLRRNFLNGRRGFINSTCNAFYAFLKEAKLYELERKNERK